MPLSSRVQPLIKAHLGINDTFWMSRRTILRIVKDVANRAYISLPVSTQVLRDYAQLGIIAIHSP